MAKKLKYEVVEEFEYKGDTVAVGTLLELSGKEAEEFSNSVKLVEGENEGGKFSAVDVLDRNKHYVRQYSEEIHGKGFWDLAEEFISDREGYTLRGVK